jgi:Na+/H+ antiporter NhaD/arsenite permease-like protein
MIPWWGVLPFVVMLLSIAVLPLVPQVAHWWEKPRIQLTISLALGLPVGVVMILAGDGWEVTHALVEYVQFVVLLGGLFVVAGGIALTGDLAGTPKVNTIFLAAGTILASFIGTTGAAMLLIRPIVRSNGHRRHRMHTVIFAIFTFANAGGLLTPLGDPPLFLGLLRGVPFTWTLGLWREWLFVNGLLLLTYYCLDKALMYDEDTSKDIVEPLGIKGGAGFIWFLAIIAAVAFAPSVDVEAIQAGHAGLVDWLPVRELIIGGAALGSWRTSSRQARFEVNGFTWAPIAEVAALFVGIFLTMVPALMLLDQRAGGLPLNAVTLYLFTGGLSAVLDNAPTYATFFEVAQNSSLAGQAGVELVAQTGVPALYLVAISTGAVFWGAMTYIGNGPNFMVRSIAENSGVKMPSFIGYMAWSARWLLPVLVGSLCLFVTESPTGLWIGLGLSAVLVLRALLLLRGRGLGIPPHVPDRPPRAPRSPADAPDHPAGT